MFAAAICDAAVLVPFVKRKRCAPPMVSRSDESVQATPNAVFLYTWEGDTAISWRT